MIIKEEKYENIRLLHLQGGGVASDVLSLLAEYATKYNLVKKGYKDALLEREKLYPTGIKAIKGIAIPHADQEYTKKETVIVVTLDKPCLFKAMGGGCGQEVKVEVLFLLILSEKKQVDALSKIVSFIQDENKMNSFDKDNSIEIIYDYFGKYL